MVILSSSLHLATPHAMRLSFPERGCVLSLSKSTSMTSMESEISWAPPSLSRTPHSHLVLWTLLRCLAHISISPSRCHHGSTHFSELCFQNIKSLKADLSICLGRLCCLLTWNVFEKNWLKTSMSCGPSLALSRVGPMV